MKRYFTGVGIRENHRRDSGKHTEGTIPTMTSERASKRQKKANGKHGDGSDAVEASIPLAKVLASSGEQEAAG